MKSRPWLWAAIIAAVWLLVPQASGLAERGQSAAATAPRTSSLPASISDEDFWKLTVDLSEPNGSFQSENLVGNERPLQLVVPRLKAMPRGGVYLGVAPDQNFTYIVALEPKIAFIVDIRRGNLRHSRHELVDDGIEGQFREAALDRRMMKKSDQSIQ